MDLIWQTLPCDILPNIFRHLDAATRRDVGMKPRKIQVLPELKLVQGTQHGDFSEVNLECADSTINLVWTDCDYFYQRILRMPFMNVNGVQVYRTMVVSQGLARRQI